MKYTQTILLAIFGLFVIFIFAQNRTTSNRITALESINHSDISSSTVTIPTSATTTETLPVMGLVSMIFTQQANISFLAQDYCIRNPNTEGCTTASTTVK